MPEKYNSNPKKAIVIFNMGGIRDLNDVETFLSNMFNDKYIIRTKIPYLRSFIAKKIVSSRKEKSKEIYSKIGGVSPSVEIFKKLAKAVKKATDIDTFLCYRYLPPYSEDVIKELKNGGYNELYLIPSYPHYSTTTTLSSIKNFTKNIKKLDYFGIKVHTLKSYFDNDFYNSGIIERIKETTTDIDTKDYILLFSSHSIPVSIANLPTDVYYSQIEMNVEILKDKLKEEGIVFKDIKMSFQSKLGRMKWLTPSTVETLKECSGENVIIYPLSFLVDNLETDYELSIEYFELKDSFGIKNYRVCKALNDSKYIVEMIKNFVESRNQKSV